jgi:hypothetical protein
VNSGHVQGLMQLVIMFKPFFPNCIIQEKVGLGRPDGLDSLGASGGLYTHKHGTKQNKLLSLYFLLSSHDKFKNNIIIILF